MSRLVLTSDEPQVLTSHVETDATTALCRGLADYVRSLSGVGYGGRSLQWDHVEETWAHPEDMGSLPAAAAYNAGATGKYDASQMSPAVLKVLDDGASLFVSSDLVLDPLTLEVWTTDDSRIDWVKLLEDAFNPVDWRFGFRLALPHYFGAFASYGPNGVTYRDSEDEAMRRHRIAVFTFHASVPVIRVARMPMARTKIMVSVDSGAAVQLPKT